MMEAIRTNKSALTYTWEGLGHMGGEALYYKCKPTILSEGKLNFFQTSSFGFRNPERHKSNSESTHYPINQEGACWQWRHRTHQKLKIVPSTSLNKYKTHRTDINREREWELPPLLQSNRKFAVIVTIHDTSQFANVATLPARLLIFTGSIWNLKRV